MLLRCALLRPASETRPIVRVAELGEEGGRVPHGRRRLGAEARRERERARLLLRELQLVHRRRDVEVPVEAVAGDARW